MNDEHHSNLGGAGAAPIEWHMTSEEMEADFLRMAAERGRMSRRDFMKTAAVVAAGAGAFAAGAQTLTGTAAKAAAALPPGKIVKVFGAAAVAEKKIDTEVAARMVNLAVMKLQDKSDAAAAWKDLFSPKDSVGLKVNSQSGPLLATSRAVIDAVIRALVGIGVPENQIVVWDSAKRDRCGYAHNTGPDGVRSYNGDEAGYEAAYALPNGIKTSVTKLLTRDTTATINMPVLKDHGITGISFALKNIAMGVTSNPGLLHPKIHTSIAEVCANEEARKRIRLHLGDALLGLFFGGPSAKPACMWECKTVLAARDPVALDAWAIETITAERKKRRLPPVTLAQHVQLAAELGLGSNRFQAVEETV